MTALLHNSGCVLHCMTASSTSMYTLVLCQSTSPHFYICVPHRGVHSLKNLRCISNTVRNMQCPAFLLYKLLSVNLMPCAHSNKAISHSSAIFGGHQIRRGHLLAELQACTHLCFSMRHAPRAGLGTVALCAS